MSQICSANDVTPWLVISSLYS